MIKEISHNPYRVLGIYADASTKDQKKILSDMRRYLSVGKTIGFQGEFHFLQNIIRNESLLNESESQLTLDDEKIGYSLFWFIDSSPVEEMALDYLSDGKDDKAVSIWQKATSSMTPSKSTFGAYNNYSSYLIATYLDKNTINSAELKKAFTLKSKLMHSDYFDNHIEVVTTKAAISLKEKVRAYYFSRILSILENDLNLDVDDIMDLLSGCDNSITDNLKTQQKEGFIDSIERETENFKKNDEVKLQQAYAFDQTCNTLLSSLEKISGSSDLEYKHLSDTVANALIEQAISFFKKFRENTSFDPGEESIQIVKLADDYIQKPNTRARFQETIEGISGWINDKPFRKAKVDIDALDEYLDELLLDDDIGFTYVESINPRALMLLKKIQSQLGSTHNTSIDRSSCYSNCINNIAVGYANTQIKSLEYSRSKESLLQVSNAFSRIQAVLNQLSDLNIDSTARARLKKNISDINKFKSDIDRATYNRSGGRKSRGIFGTLKKMFFE